MTCQIIYELYEILCSTYIKGMVEFITL